MLRQAPQSWTYSLSPLDTDSQLQINEGADESELLLTYLQDLSGMPY